MDIFDIIGPIMIGPSSSHTAGAVRIGGLARAIFGQAPTKVEISLYNSFSKTGKGHGTDKALIAGLLGFSLDNPVIKEAYEIAEELGIVIDINYAGENIEYHPNLAEITLYSGENIMKVKGISLGGGRVEINEIDGYETAFTGKNPSLFTIHKDVPGRIAIISSIFLREKINIAFIHLYRSEEDDNVLMILETDAHIPESILSEVKKIKHIKSASLVNIV